MKIHVVNKGKTNVKGASTCPWVIDIPPEQNTK
jgi:hypothetical protein